MAVTEIRVGAVLDRADVAGQDVVRLINHRHPRRNDQSWL
jgi:hypothetical protein